MILAREYFSIFLLMVKPKDHITTTSTWHGLAMSGFGGQWEIVLINLKGPIEKLELYL